MDLLRAVQYSFSFEVENQLLTTTAGIANFFALNFVLIGSYIR